MVYLYCDSLWEPSMAEGFWRFRLRLQQSLCDILLDNIFLIRFYFVYYTGDNIWNNMRLKVVIR